MKRDIKFPITNGTLIYCQPFCHLNNKVQLVHKDKMVVNKNDNSANGKWIIKT